MKRSTFEPEKSTYNQQEQTEQTEQTETEELTWKPHHLAESPEVSPSDWAFRTDPLHPPLSLLPPVQFDCRFSVEKLRLRFRLLPGFLLLPGDTLRPQGALRRVQPAKQD